MLYFEIDSNWNHPINLNIYYAFIEKNETNKDHTIIIYINSDFFFCLFAYWIRIPPMQHLIYN